MSQELLKGLPVVTSKEMVRLEQIAFASGKKDSVFMENAGKAVAKAIESFIEAKHLPKTVFVMVGKGNKGGDAFVAAAQLLKKGYQVSCLALYPLEKCTVLQQKQANRFLRSGGKIQFWKSRESITLPKDGIILDGLVGTGFKGKAEGILAEAIQVANLSHLPILAIDIPSGLDGSTGEVGSIAIKAAQTFFLGLPKWGFFSQAGWDHVGELIGLNFGMEPAEINQAKAMAYLFSEEHAKELLPPIKRTRHKYERGYVLSIAGSPGMSGAAIMAGLATLRSGAGIVRWFYPKELHSELTMAPLELLKEVWDLENDQRILEEAKRAKALIIGPGIGRAPLSKQMFFRLLKQIKLPCVIDADALFFLAEEKKWILPASCVLTPHHQEMKRLLSNHEPTLQACQQFVEDHEVTLVLKGAPTFIFHPGASPLIMTHGSPAMATAGTGDVLTGIIAALLAQGAAPLVAATLGVYIHGLAGEAAANANTSYSVIASDLIDFIPEAYHLILND